MENKPNLSGIKELLKRGDAKEAARRAGVTTMTIYNVINGKHPNAQVLETVVQVVTEREVKRRQVIEQLISSFKTDY